MNTKTNAADLYNGKHYSEWVRLAVDNNPRGVYDFIQRNYDSPLPNWFVGFENQPMNRDKMAAFINDRLQQANNSAQYLIEFLKAIPHATTSK